jgi:hypothetical protein
MLVYCSAAGIVSTARNAQKISTSGSIRKNVSNCAVAASTRTSST